jgi:hypothetical protein
MDRRRGLDRVNRPQDLRLPSTMSSGRMADGGWSGFVHKQLPWRKYTAAH